MIKSTRMHTIFSRVNLALVGCALLILQNGCGVPPSTRPGGHPPPGVIVPDYREVPEPVVPGPAAPLYLKAEQLLAAGSYAQAEMTLERALRIEPQNSRYWYAMAQAKYGQGRYRQTVNFCLKSKSLAGQNADLLQLNEELIQRANEHLK